ncbi:MAG TPA: TlpA disulfide reductase family protein [Steroidobacteraceae bacterium]|nr:TlpA disulfide reductase family protein [Steroidobacteraceae bacterium]
MSDQRPGSRPVGLLVAGVLLAAAIAGFLAHRLTTSAPPLAGAPEKVAASKVEAQSAPAGTPNSRTHPIPEQLPPIALPDRRGATRRLTDWQGKPLLINFWATWCEPCRREIPLLKTLRREHSADGLEVVGIAIDHLDAVQQYAADHGIDYPVLIGEERGLAAASAFGMEVVLPFSVFADHSGRIVALKVGELHRDEAELILRRVHDVDTGRLSLPAARTEISDGLRRLSVARVASGG